MGSNGHSICVQVGYGFDDLQALHIEAAENLSEVLQDLSRMPKGPALWHITNLLEASAKCIEQAKRETAFLSPHSRYRQGRLQIKRRRQGRT
jgi:hypothetical protein